MDDLVFKKHDDPLSLFLSGENHYNSTGYKLISEQIANYIQKR